MSSKQEFNWKTRVQERIFEFQRESAKFEHQIKLRVPKDDQSLFVETLKKIQNKEIDEMQLQLLQEDQLNIQLVFKLHDRQSRYFLAKPEAHLWVGTLLMDEQTLKALLVSLEIDKSDEHEINLAKLKPHYSLSNLNLIFSF